MFTKSMQMIDISQIWNEERKSEYIRALENEEQSSNARRPLKDGPSVRKRFVRPVTQLVERWTPGSESPGSRRSGARYMKLLTGMARLVGAAAAS